MVMDSLSRQFRVYAATRCVIMEVLNSGTSADISRGNVTDFGPLFKPAARIDPKPLP